MLLEVLEVVLVVLEVVLVVLVVVLTSRCPFQRLQSARQISKAFMKLKFCAVKWRQEAKRKLCVVKPKLCVVEA